VPVVPVTSFIGGLIEKSVHIVGNYMLFVGQALTRMVPPHVNPRLLLQQLEFVGSRSFMIAVMAGIMVGGIFGFQLGEIFAIFGAESLIGASTGFALARELAPIVGSFLVTARAGSAMAAEIASMKVNEQIDSMRVMSVDPFAYLMAPRILASMIAMPLIASMMVFAGVVTSFVVGVSFYNIDVADFFARLEWIVDTEDLFMGMQKAALFGFIFSSIGCFEGYRARGGAKGVGRATTQAVVTSYVTILVLDFFITYIQFKFQHN
jgi:phospholipid/cholesterol/gamma-HCH transport system permease protein